MALFRKKASEQPPMDADLTFLTIEQAQRVRTLVRGAFAERGLEVTVFADHVRDAGDRQFGLWNVAAACHNDERGETAWGQVVDDHVARLVTNLDAPDPFQDLSPAEAASRTYARLYGTAGLPTNLDDFPHSEFAPGLVEMLALDLPDTVAVYKREQVERLGGWVRLRQAGLANLRNERADTVKRVESGDAHFQLVLGESVYTASRALLLPALAQTLTGEEPDSSGWLLGVPNRHQVCWHMIRDKSVIPSLNGMAHFTRLGYSDAPGPLSPHVYWWDGQAYRQLTQFDETGELTVHVDPEFQEVLERAVEH